MVTNKTMNKSIELYKNKYWDVSPKRVSIITPVYNRREELQRALMSIKNQIYREIEYIIVNDGSAIDIDDIVLTFMDVVSFPVLYIKKENGGVHTARNIAISHARGEMICCCDSDDELLPNAVEILISKWDSIDADKKPLYREICARCVDEKGNEDGPEFPQGINELPWKKAYKLSNKIGGEHFGFWRRDTLLECPWPEPEGITFVAECIVWDKLSKKYRSYFVNDAVRVYHKENDESYTRSKKDSIQSIKNSCWNRAYLINYWRIDAKPKMPYLKAMISYIVFKQILKRKKVNVKWIKLDHFVDRFVCFLIWIFVIPISIIYEKKNCDH